MSAIAQTRPAGARRGRRVLASVACLALGIFYALPLVWVASMSVRSQEDAVEMTLLPRSFRLANFSDAWTNLHLSTLFANTIFIAIGTVVLSIGMSVLAAYGFVRWRSRLTDGVFLLILLGMMVPPAGMIVPFFVLVQNLGLYDSLVSVILAETAFSIPLAVLLLRGYIERIPTELIDAARVDGASPWRAFVHVVLPLLAPAVATASLFILLFAWNDLLLPLVLLPDPSGSTLVVGLSQTIGQYGQINLGLLGAAALLALLPILVVFIAARRYYVQGVAAGALKG